MLSRFEYGEQVSRKRPEGVKPSSPQPSHITDVRASGTEDLLIRGLTDRFDQEVFLVEIHIAEKVLAP